jgi:hypothetical protein
MPIRKTIETDSLPFIFIGEHMVFLRCLCLSIVFILLIVVISELVVMFHLLFWPLVLLIVFGVILYALFSRKKPRL